jgi:tetratricopeptide (TPR) repeat protein
MNFLIHLKRQALFASVLFLLIQSALLTSCKKYLDKKPVISEFEPVSFAQLRTLLDRIQNVGSNSATAEQAADNFYALDNQVNPMLEAIRMQYIWNAQSIHTSVEWSSIYTGPIYNANLVLSYVDRVQQNEGDIESYNEIKGAALFIRAYHFHQLAQLFCKPYKSETANTDYGLVLKLNTSLSEKVSRESVQKTYDQIIADLKEASLLLPENTSTPIRPNKAAAFAALARVYLNMRDYTEAANYASQALTIRNQLLNYNNYIPYPVASARFPKFHKEIIFFSYNFTPAYLADFSWAYSNVDTSLYKSYDNNDLRKQLFFRAKSTEPGYGFFGGYYDLSPMQVFDGLTTAELYLIRAEANSKNGNKDNALSDLNYLMTNRWNAAVPYPTITASSASEALQKVRVERRKELIFRGLRWSDLRRYNLEDSTISLRRIYSGTQYTLPPNDNRWVMLIPQEEITRSGIVQNPR